MIGIPIIKFAFDSANDLVDKAISKKECKKKKPGKFSFLNTEASDF